METKQSKNKLLYRKIFQGCETEETSYKLNKNERYKTTRINLSGSTAMFFGYRVYWCVEFASNMLPSTTK